MRNRNRLSADSKVGWMAKGGVWVVRVDQNESPVTEAGKWWGAMMRRMLDEQLSKAPKTTQLNRVNEGSSEAIEIF